jgi:hypothetical protein
VFERSRSHCRRSGPLREELGTARETDLCICEADADLQPWDENSDPKQPLTGLYDAASIWVYGDFDMRAPERPDIWPKLESDPKRCKCRPRFSSSTCSCNAHRSISGRAEINAVRKSGSGSRGDAPAIPLHVGESSLNSSRVRRRVSYDAGNDAR